MTELGKNNWHVGGRSHKPIFSSIKWCFIFKKNFIFVSLNMRRMQSSDAVRNIIDFHDKREQTLNAISLENEDYSRCNKVQTHCFSFFNFLRVHWRI